MKKIGVFFLTHCITILSYAQIEMYGRSQNGNVEPEINIFGAKKIADSGKISLTYFALVEQKWAQTYVGISYAPKKWFGLGLSAGIEQSPAIYRLAGNLCFSKGKTSLLFFGEKGDGKDNYFYEIIVSYKASKTFTLDALAWRFHGEGVMVKYTPKKSDLTFWVFPAYDWEQGVKRFVSGVQIKI